MSDDPEDLIADLRATLAEEYALGDADRQTIAALRAQVAQLTAKNEELETAKANYHDKWLNACDKAVDLVQENARLREEIRRLLPLAGQMPVVWLVKHLNALIASSREATEE